MVTRRLLAALLLSSSCLAITAHADDDASSLSEGMKSASKPLLKALSLIGTPYKFGGSKPESGLDCSGLVRHVYKQTTTTELPRNASEMSRRGLAVNKDELQPGDLVFFNTMRRPFSHVGIYKGDGKFVHASSSRTRSVMVSDLREPYWAQRYNGARRLPAVD